LIIFNIPNAISESQVYDILDPYGEIRIFKLIKDPERSDLNRCYVKFTTKEQALLAVKELNGLFGFPGAEGPLELVFADQFRGPKQKAVKEEINQYENIEIKDQQKQEAIVSDVKRVYYEFKSPEGVPYYFDIQSNKTQWEKPNEPNAVVLSESEYYKTLQNGGQQQEVEPEEEVEAENDTIKLIIKNLPTTWEESDFYSFVNTYGNYSQTKILDQGFLEQNDITSEGLKVGMVEITDPTHAQNLVNSINGLEIHG